MYGNGSLFCCNGRLFCCNGRCPALLLKVQRTVKGMRWKTLLANHEDGPNVPEKVLFAVKRYWTAAGEGTAAEEKTPGSSSVAGMDSEE